MHLVKRIQKRLACIIISVPDRMKLDNIRVVKPSPEPLDELIVKSSHSAFWPDGSDRVHCARCHSSFQVRDPNLRSWLGSPCSKIGASNDRPTTLPYESIHIGNKTAHYTHKLVSFRGLVYCCKCGTRGTTQLRKLAKECSPPTSYGKISLARLREGQRPPNMTRGVWADVL